MKQLRNVVNFSLDSLEDFADSALATRTINAILTGPQFTIPVRFGTYEPLDRVINPRDISPLVELWVPSVANDHLPHSDTREGILSLDRAADHGYLIYWRKGVEPSFPGISGWIPWSVLEEEPARLQELISFIKTLVGVVNPVYGQLENLAVRGTGAPRDLQKRLPDVPWLSIYGQPYVEMFGESCIANAPFFSVEKLPSGHYMLLATENIKEPVSESLRAKIRNHFDEDAFMSGGRWRYKDGRAPKFDFSNVLAK